MQTLARAQRKLVAESEAEMTWGDDDRDGDVRWLFGYRCCHYVKLRYAAGVAYIDRLFVRRRYRGRGLSLHIALHALAVARYDGAKQIRTFTAVSNAPMRRALKSAGFHVTRYSGARTNRYAHYARTL